MPVPPAATPFICTMPSPLVLTPVVKLMRFVRLRRLTGSSRTSCDPRVSDCSDAAVSISGASPATVTVSASCADFERERLAHSLTGAQLHAAVLQRS